MSEIFTKIIPGYIEKLLAPVEIWCVLLLTISALLFTPVQWQTFLGISTLVEEYRPYLVIILIASAAAILVKFFKFLRKRILTTMSLDEANLNSEEIAILFFFSQNQYQSVSLLCSHPSVTSLRNRGFLHYPPSPVYIFNGDGMQLHSLTDVGEKRIKSARFKNKHSFSKLENTEILNFINVITPTNLNYEIHKQHRFS